MRALLCTLALMAASGVAFADVDTTIVRGNSAIDAALSGSHVLDFYFTGLDPNAVTGAALTFRARGDFNSNNEYIHIQITDGTNVVYGRWLDGNSGNDAINSGSDVGTQYTNVHTATAGLSLGALLPRIADGDLRVRFTYSSAVNNLFNDDFASVRLRYRTGNNVPEPASLALLGTGVAAVALRIRRRRRA